MNIQLRVWDGEKMVYEVGLDPNGIAYSIPDYAEDSDQFIYYPDCPVMMETGLKDKKGKKIYGGDIVSTDLSRPYLIVEFRNGAFMYQCHHGSQDYYDHMEPAFHEEIEQTKYHEIIGNIYENPELAHS